ncbi:MAG TPA: alpha/beta hydrolase [Actinomycetota bacterium]|nr:alpha/beta hydrolase [Actinomycetota bacterium]
MAQPGYAAENQPVALDGVTELLVHGVGGESAEDTLHEPHPRMVAGDATAGFYRGPDTDGRHRESYSWGGLTSGRASRALWLLLLPFALANLAGWMHWRRRGQREPGRFRALIRVFGLSLTVLGVLYVCSIAFDLIAYQCGGDPACVGAQRSSQPVWSPLRWVSLLDAGWLAGNQLRQLAAAAVLPLAVVGLLGFLARSTRERYEQSKPAGVVDYELDGRNPFKMHTEKARSIGLDAPWFWYGEPLARTLGRAHLAAGIAVIAWSVAAAAEALGGTSRFIGAGRALAWVVLAVAVVAMCAPRPLGVKRWRWDLRGLVSVALVALAVVAAGCWAQPASAGTSRSLPGLSDVAGVVFGTHLLLILALVVDSVVVAVTMGRRRRQPGSDMDADTLRCGPLAAVVLSTVTLNSLLAGLSVRTADALGRGVAIGSPTPGEPAPAIWYPRVYDLFAVGFVAGLLLVLVLLAVAWLTTGRDQPTSGIAAEYDDDRAAEDAVLSALPPAPGAGGRNDLERSQRRWLAGIRVRRRLAELVTRLDWALLAVSVVTVAMALIGFVADQLGRPLSVPNGVWWGRLSAACTWVVTLIPWAAVAVVLSGYRDRGRRRQLGVLWDVGMFWPRAFHPLAPPSYAERAVPDLEERIGRLTRDRDGRQGRVLLMAHSQGTVLAAAALRQLASSEGTARRRVILVTYGAPLARLYRRAFPAYFGDGMFAELDRDLDAAGTRWRNYHRRTDLIGGPVFTGTDALDRGHGDRLLRDPFTHWYVPRDPAPPALGHSGYMLDPAMRHEVDDLAGQLLVEAATPAPAPEPSAPETSGV